MNNKPCVTVLEHDDDFILIEINGKLYNIKISVGRSMCWELVANTMSIKPSGLTVFTFKDFTIYHQNGGDCYVE